MELEIFPGSYITQPVTANATLPVLIAGFELHLSNAQVMWILIVLCVVVAFHVAALAFIISGHVKLWRTKRAGRLVYVLPLTWYGIALTACWLAWEVYPHVDWPYSWPMGRHPEFESNYLFIVLVIAAATAHGFLLEKLLRQPGRPTLCRLVLFSAGWVTLLPPLGIILAWRALRRIRNSEGRLYGCGGAWSSLVINGLVSMYLLVCIAIYLYDGYDSGPGPFAAASVPASAPSVISNSPPGPLSAATVPANRSTVVMNPERPDLGSGPFSGKWLAQFTFEQNTRNTAEPRHLWFAFSCTIAQREATVHGNMNAIDGSVSGRLSGSSENGRFHGTMRLSWDQHDWEELTLTLNPDTSEGTGQAVFRASENERHYYTIVLRREHK